MRPPQPRHLDATERKELAELCMRHSVLRLDLFGSGSAGEFTEESDLDFLVEFRELTPSEHASAYFGLLFGLEILFRRKIDLVERSAIENPYLLRSIERSRRIVYEAA